MREHRLATAQGDGKKENRAFEFGSDIAFGGKKPYKSTVAGRVTIDKSATTDKASATRGRLMIILAAVMWSSSGFFARSPCFDSWPEAKRGLLFAFWRALFATLVLLPFVRRPRWSPVMVPMTGTFLVMNMAYLSAMVLTTPANAVWLQNTAPVWVLLLGMLLLGERATRRDWQQLCFVMLGVGVILAFELRGQRPIGVLCGIVGAITYGGVVTSLRYLRDYDSAWLIALNHLVTAACMFPFVVSQGIWPDATQLIYLCGFGAFQMGIPYLLFARGLRHISGHEASRLVLIEPVLVPLWVYIAWHHLPGYQAPGWWTFVGGGLILIGLLLRLISVDKKESNTA